MTKEQTIEIPLDEYEELSDDSLMLMALQDAGVDNWSGYDYAIELYQNLKSPMP